MRRSVIPKPHVPAKSAKTWRAHDLLLDSVNMDLRPSIYWALPALLTAMTGWWLTGIITHVDPNAKSTLTVVYDGSPARQNTLTGVSLSRLQRERYDIPGVIVSSMQHALLVVTPETRSFEIKDLIARGLSCNFSFRVYKNASPAFFLEAARRDSLAPAPIKSTADGGTLIVIPPALHEALARARNGQGLITCDSSRQIAGSPTFTERSLGLHVEGLTGLFMFDVSGLEDIDNVRFTGGVAFPLAGDRTRFLDSSDNIVSTEWVDVSAEQLRDIVLIIIGALAAISAALWIETIRPFIERRS